MSSRTPSKTSSLSAQLRSRTIPELRKLVVTAGVDTSISRHGKEDLIKLIIRRAAAEKARRTRIAKQKGDTTAPPKRLGRLPKSLSATARATSKAKFSRKRAAGAPANTKTVSFPKKVKPAPRGKRTSSLDTAEKANALLADLADGRTVTVDGVRIKPTQEDFARGFIAANARIFGFSYSTNTEKKTTRTAPSSAKARSAHLQRFVGAKAHEDEYDSEDLDLEDNETDGEADS